MEKNKYLTNLFNRETNCSSYGTIANNGRAQLKEGRNGKLFVIIDGITHEADRNDIFGMNVNLNRWLDKFVEKYDKQMKSSNNEIWQNQVSYCDKKMAENEEQLGIIAKTKVAIKAAIKQANEALNNFLAQCGVHFRHQLSGDKKIQADALNNSYWTERYNLTRASNSEYNLAMDNCSLAFDKGKANNQIAFNNAMLERTSFS